MTRRGNSGTKHHLARMDEAKVAEARSRYASGGVTQEALANHFGVDSSTMGAILRNESWKHVGTVSVARNITVESDEGWRAAIQFRMEDTGELVTYYEGIYDKKGTVNQRISFWRNAGRRWFYEGPEWRRTNQRLGIFEDAWPEKATITWEKVE